MTHDEFNGIVKHVFDKCTTMLVYKATEYADEDRLSQFKKASRMAGCTPEQALVGFRLKHDTALADYVKWQAEGKQVPWAWWTEKIFDIVNYNVLLYALVAERYEDTKLDIEGE